jgi:cytochrome oxidase Cu insertion factor (SCO1/SenC/PrrC family)
MIKILPRCWAGYVFALLYGLLITSCSSIPPEGTPIDFESIGKFKPFSLIDLEGTETSLDDVLGEATLISFFFPT